MLLKKNKSILLLSSILVLPFMLITFYSTTKLYGIKQGYFIGFIVYWIYCVAFAIILFKKQNKNLSDILYPNLKSRKAFLYSLLTLIPILGVFFVHFLPNINSLTIGIILMVLVNSVVNGFIEELYWRGLFLLEFKQNIWIGLWLSTFLFGAWHIALYSIKDISYGGFFALVGGSAFMGLLWSFCSRKLNSIAFPVIAHILVNIFAFTGLYVENGF